MIYLSPLRASPEDDRDFIYKPIDKFPDVVQMRSLVGDIEDQGMIGSCTANSTVSACEIILQRNGNHRHLSRLFNYYVTRKLEGRLGQEGAVLRNSVKQASKLGLPDEAIWGYSESDAEVEPPFDVFEEASKHKLLRYERIQDGTNEEVIHSIKSAIAEGFPVVFGMPVTAQWMNMRGGDLTYRGSKIDKSLGGHAMTIIGYSIDYFVVENSWGKDWGDGGLGYIPCALVDEFIEAWVIRGFDTEPVPEKPAEPVLPVVPVPAATEDYTIYVVIAFVIILMILVLS